MAALLRDDRARLVRRASLLRLTAAALAQNIRGGGFKSLYRGHGIEFSGVREYFTGDDVRSIDWNVTARMARPFVKMYEEERELQIFLIVDRSLSMQTGVQGKSRLETAAEAAALLTLAAEQNASPVGAVLFDGALSFSCAPETGRDHSMLILSHLDRMNEQPVRGSVLGNALTGAERLLRHRSLIFVISDFRAAGWELPFARLAGHHDVVAVRITDPADSELPDVGTIPFADPETGDRVVLPTSSSVFARAWFDDNRRRLEKWTQICIKRGGYPVLLSVTEDPVAVLSRFFTQRERV
jgi:uncharacterized protein (DUF58 family)